MPCNTFWNDGCLRPRWDLKRAVKQKTDASALVLYFFFLHLKSTPSQLWLLREYEIVATFFGLRMRPRSSHTKFLIRSLWPNSPTRIVSRLSSRMWISMADGKPDKIANCIVTSCGFFCLTILVGSRVQEEPSLRKTAAFEDGKRCLSCDSKRAFGANVHFNLRSKLKHHLRSCNN